MSNAETIKDFLVSLGFELDESGEKKFSAVVAGVTANVLKMGAVVEGAALAVVGFTTKIASGLDKVYFASQRTGASVAGIKALGYAASQLGVDAASAQGSLESLARFIRNSPGAEGFLNRLGIQTRSANGSMRDTSAIFTGLSAKLSSMPYYRANQYAQMLGIDENTLMAMRKGLGQFSTEYALTAKRIGFNAEIAATQSNRFMTSMRNLTMTLGQARDKIGANLANGLAGDIDALRKQLLDNWPKIEAVLMKVIKGILWAGDAVSRVLWRTGQAIDDVMSWFKKLDPVTQQLIMLFGGLLVAWRLLNTAFLTSPVGIVLSLGAGLFALYDDYKTWKEGGESLIDWGQWEQEINAALKGIDELTKSIKGVGVEIARLLNINLKNWTLKGDIENLTKQFGEFGKMLSMIGDLINALKEGNWGEVARIGKALLSQGGDQPDAMPVVTDSANSAADWVKDKTGFDPRSVGRWLRGESNGTEPDQYAQSVKRPTASASGAALLGWLQPTLTKLEALNNLPAGLLRSVAITESAGNQFAISGAGAKGLFQFMDPTAKDMGLKGNDVFDPEKSAAAAAKYLSMLLKMNGGDLDKALASYNWGIGNVQKHGLDLMPPETRNYIPKVRSNMPSGGLQQETNINIYGATDPVAVGSEIAGRQTNVNARLTQQLNTSTR
ncbi:TPA: transglycosylase SLT domain-containing protein [Yersinia enterocolitica]|uniref:lytic transglycosylase domain-containing protein n=1 Tax=Yersinia enterocolitica TaxID=630 RepID=UPI0005E45A3F|nr:lytic transglycosylase domain-containing protein [Yersinia enterocolitica]EKN4720253.1 transglycosylase SLT domain-containing protein [Yersinia enterocolitica]EKN4732361.1 transglycosylase SLT domain-containing protein [Yersinia enterocolitica]EKN5163821.1 lytic transglycosylase domain-containing protein [Yersinia enterocolitica]EKN6075630.1 lytic transglycosylase domain-containing protein [Yersinia enterocolitica]CNL80907.1 Membrane-bound lytic murein transglycosylase D precursor [Yersinia